MGYREKRFGQQRVDLGNGYWIDIKAATKGAVMEVTLQLADSSNEEKARINDELLAQFIVAWNLDDDAGQPLPVNAATIADMHPADYAVLGSAFTALLNPLADKQVRQD